MVELEVQVESQPEQCTVCLGGIETRSQSSSSFHARCRWFEDLSTYELLAAKEVDYWTAIGIRVLNVRII